MDGVWVTYKLDLIGRDQTTLLDFDAVIRDQIIAARAPWLDAPANAAR